MSHDDDRFAATLRRLADVGCRCAGCEPFVDVRLAEPERLRGLSRAPERARKHRIRGNPVGAQRLPELPGLLASGRRQRAQLVWVAGRRLGMADD
jgi:hypothetical protein